jgi:hypothetical protein
MLHMYMDVTYLKSVHSTSIYCSGTRHTAYGIGSLIIVPDLYNLMLTLISDKPTQPNICRPE